MKAQQYLQLMDYLDEILKDPWIDVLDEPAKVVWEELGRDKDLREYEDVPLEEILRSIRGWQEAHQGY